MKRFFCLLALLNVLAFVPVTQAAVPVSGPGQPPVIISADTASGAVGVRFSYRIAATNSPASFASQFLPPGLTLDEHTGLISGSPTAAGTYIFYAFAINPSGTDGIAVTLTVVGVPPTIYTANDGGATVNAGQAYTYQISANGNPVSYAAAGLPQGLTVDTATGIISGTPFAVGVYAIGLSATNANGTGTGVLVLTVASDLPVVTVEATVPKISSDSGDAGAITFKRTGDLSQKMVVTYVVSGSGRNGLDYTALSGFKKIKPNKDSATIHVVPRRSLVAGEVRTVKVKVLFSTGYQIGDQVKAKVKIVPGD